MYYIKKLYLNFIFISVFFMAGLLLHFYPYGYERYILNLGLIVSAVFLFFSNSYFAGHVKLFFYSLIVFVAWLLFIYVVKGKFHYSLFVAFLSCMLVGYVFIYSKNSMSYMMFSYYLSFVLLFLVLFALLSGVDANEILSGSRNSISLLLIGIASIFLIDKRFHNEFKFGFIFYLLIFIICVMLMGRSGILTSLLLLCAYILLLFKKPKSIKLTIYASLLVFVFFVFFYSKEIHNTISSDFVYLDYFLAKGFEDSYRSNMRDEYFYNMSVLDMIFGRDLSSLDYISSFNLNPHNAYINYHSAFGFLFLVFLLLFVMFFVKKMLSFDAICLLALLAVILRLYTDSVSDISIFSFVFSILMLFERTKFTWGKCNSLPFDKNIPEYKES